MTHDPAVPQADAAEQDAPVAAEPPAIEEIGAVGERPEADVLEQAAPVRTDRPPAAPVRRDDVPDADAWEQAIDAPLDDDDRG